MAYQPPSLRDLVPGNLGLEIGVPRSTSVSRGASVFFEIPDCDTSLYIDGPGGIIFPQSAGSYGCVAPLGGIPHPSAMIRYDGIAGAGAGAVITVDAVNIPGKTMTVAGMPAFQQPVVGWAKRAMTLPQTSSTGLKIPFDANGSWWDVGRHNVAKLLWFAVTSSGGSRPFYSLAGTSIMLRILSNGTLNLFTAAGSVSGTYDYRHGGVRTFHPFLIAIKHATQEIKVWTDKEAITGVWTYASDLEKGPYVLSQAPPDCAWLGEDTWVGDKATIVFDLGKNLLTRLNWSVAY